MQPVCGGGSKNMRRCCHEAHIPGAQSLFLLAGGLVWSVLCGAPLTLRAEVNAPRFSPERGLYDAPVTVEIRSSTAGAAIRYTVDGSEPTRSRGMRYEGPLRVEGASGQAVVTLRAVAYTDAETSETNTSTYIFPDWVPSQPADPPGFPRRWGDAPAVDYGMDPEITSDPQYSRRLIEGLRDLPTVSLVTEVDYLFGSDGIYSNPLFHGEEWERPTSLEIIYPDDREDFQVNCGVRILGGASRQPVNTPKHSFRIAFRDIYGPGRLKVKLFPDSHVRIFDGFVLRADLHNSWLHIHRSQRVRGQNTRDQWSRDSQLALGHLSPHGYFVHLYINGLYWGLYNLHERPEADFHETYFGGTEEDYDVLNSGEAIDGDRRAWEDMMDLAEGGLRSNSRYREIQEILDVTNLADYMIFNIYAGMSDWPYHNWYAGRRREPGALFRFYVWDGERCLEHLDDDRTDVDAEDSPGRLYRRLRENAEFRLLFADRVHSHLFNGGALTPEAVLRRWMARATEINEAVVAESARWGDYRRDVHTYESGPYDLYTRDDHWLAQQDRIVKEIVPERTQVVLGQLKSTGLYPDQEAPVLSRQGGAIQPGQMLSMKLPQGATGTIYYTTDGSDPRVEFTGGVSPAAQVYAAPLTLTDTTVVKARTLGEEEWSAVTEAFFLLGVAPARLHITEIMYHPPAGGSYEFLELHNADSRPADLSGLQFTNGIAYTFPQDSVLEAGGYLVLVSDPSDFSDLYPDVPIEGVFGGSLDNAGEKVTLQDSGGATLISVDYDDDDFWPLGPDGFGFSLVLADTRTDPDDPRTWRASAEPGGSPGREDPEPLHGGVIIHEILTASTDPLEDAIELRNLTSRSVDIGGWYLSDSRNSESDLREYRIPDGTIIPAGGYKVFYEAQFNSQPGRAGSFALNSAGDDVYLASGDGGELTGYVFGYEFEGAEDQVSFGRHVTSVGKQVLTAMSRRTFGADEPETLEEFRTGTGAPNAYPAAGMVVINEIHYHPLGGNVEFLELVNRTEDELELYDRGTSRGWRISGIQDSRGDDFEFERGAIIPPWGYLIVTNFAPGDFRDIYGLPDDTPVEGPYSGGLDNSGERLRLLKPNPDASGSDDYIVVDDVRYNDTLPWPVRADGDGPSLEKVRASRFGDDPVEWRASRVVGGTPAALNTVGVPEDPQGGTSDGGGGGGGGCAASVSGSRPGDTAGGMLPYLLLVGVWLVLGARRRARSGKACAR